MTPRCAFAGVMLALCAGCQSVHPLGDDFPSLTGSGQINRAADVMREVFATELGPAGEPIADRDVQSIDAAQVVYLVDERPVTLAWTQVVDVDVESFPRAAGRPETVRLLLDPESPQVADAVRPFLARAGLKRAYVELALRPSRSGERVRAALACFRRERVALDPPPADQDPSAAPAGEPAGSADSAEPPASNPPVVGPGWQDAEAQLRQLKAWHTDGLISDEDYDRKRRELLDALR